MPNATLTLTLPENTWRYLNQMALATHQPLEQVVRQNWHCAITPIAGH